MKRLCLPALLAGLLCTGAAGAQTPAVTGALQIRQAIDARKATYVLTARTLAPLTAMAQGKAAFNAADALKRAQRLEFLAEMAIDFYPAGSLGATSRATPKIWEQWPEFDGRLQELLALSRTLAAQLRGPTDVEGFRRSVTQLSATCKGCHEKYRSE